MGLIDGIKSWLRPRKSEISKKKTAEAGVKTPTSPVKREPPEPTEARVPRAEKGGKRKQRAGHKTAAKAKRHRRKGK